jgi:hypothetical protein
MAVDKIDQEFHELMQFMEAEQAVDDLLLAIKMLIQAEKMDAGLVRRQFVADALGLLIQSLPAAWDSVCEANQDLTNDHQRQGAIRVAMAMLFDTLSVNHLALAASNAHAC